jgi:Fic family protein
LTHRVLGEWHAMLVNGRSDLHDEGTYRTHADPMQVVSGPVHRPFVHFEAPPSHLVPRQMEEFITWFNASQFDPSLNALERAGIAHLYFECIHPFEDGNGRIGRVIVEKALAQAVDRPLLLALSREISRTKKDYYRSLQLHNQGLEITGWLEYFGKVVVESQHKAMELVNFMIEKTKYLDRYAPLLNERQLKVILRMTEAGPDGFEGGLSAKNYQRISPTSEATVTRDLSQLVELGALVKTGQLKSTRYYLKLAKSSESFGA